MKIKRNLTSDAIYNKMICEIMRLVVEKAHDQYEKFIPDQFNLMEGKQNAMV